MNKYSVNKCVAMETLRNQAHSDSFEFDSDDDLFSSSDDGEIYHKQKKAGLKKRHKTKPNTGMPLIQKSSDLTSKMYEQITKDLFQLRESNKPGSLEQLDNQTQRWHNYFVCKNRLNMAMVMKLVKFKNLYFRKDYKAGISVLTALHQQVQNHIIANDLKDLAYIKGKIAFNLAYAYFATKKYDSAQKCLDCAKLQLYHTEGGEDKADLYYFEGKMLDFFIQSSRPTSSAERMRSLRNAAVDAYRRSRDNTLLASRDAYVTQRAMYRSLQMVKVHLDFPDSDKCSSREIVSESDLDSARLILNEVESHMKSIQITPRFKARFLLANSELYFRRSQFKKKNNGIDEAIAEIDNAYNLTAEAHSLVHASNFAEKQTALKMMTLYKDVREDLERQRTISAGCKQVNNRTSYEDNSKATLKAYTAINTSSKLRKADKLFVELPVHIDSESDDWKIPFSSEFSDPDAKVCNSNKPGPESDVY